LQTWDSGGQWAFADSDSDGVSVCDIVLTSGAWVERNPEVYRTILPVWLRGFAYGIIFWWLSTWWHFHFTWPISDTSDKYAKAANAFNGADMACTVWYLVFGGIVIVFT
jgi:hypothetical protein